MELFYLITKAIIFDVMDFLAKVKAEAPIKIGEPIVQNILDTGVDVVATKNISKKD